MCVMVLKELNKFTSQIACISGLACVWKYHLTWKLMFSLRWFGDKCLREVTGCGVVWCGWWEPRSRGIYCLTLQGRRLISYSSLNREDIIFVSPCCLCVCVCVCGGGGVAGAERLSMLSIDWFTTNSYKFYANRGNPNALLLSRNYYWHQCGCANLWGGNFLLLLLLLSVGIPVANAPVVLQPCGLLYYP